MLSSLTHAHARRLWTGLPAASLNETRQGEKGGVGVKERARFDAAFLQKVLDVKRRLQDTRYRLGITTLSHHVPQASFAANGQPLSPPPPTLPPSPLSTCSIEYATPLERSSGHVRSFLRSSNARIQVCADSCMLSHNPPDSCATEKARCVWCMASEHVLASCCCRVPHSQFLRAHVRVSQVVVDRVDTVRTQRDLHVEILNLLKDNAALRTSARNTCILVSVLFSLYPRPLATASSSKEIRTQVNDYAEGLLADTFDLLDEAPANARMSRVPV